MDCASQLGSRKADRIIVASQVNGQRCTLFGYQLKEEDQGYSLVTEAKLPRLLQTYIKEGLRL